MLSTTSTPTEYICAYICVPKQHEEALYRLLSCVSSNALTFMGFKGFLQYEGIPEAHAKLYNNCYMLDGVKLGGEMAYDISDAVVGEFIEYVESCTGGQIRWLIGAFVEVNGWGNIKKIEAAIASDPDLKECAYIEQIL